MRETYRTGDLTLTLDDDLPDRPVRYTVCLERDGRRMPISEAAGMGDPIEGLRRFLARDYIRAQFDAVIA